MIAFGRADWRLTSQNLYGDPDLLGPIGGRECGKGHEVNKAELVTALAEHLDGDRKTAASAVDGLLDVIVRTVHAGDSVSLTGFGVFERRERAARAGRNPRTGQVIEVPATAVPAFRPGAGFRDVVSGAREPGAGPAAPAAARPAPTPSRAARPAVARASANKASTNKASANKASTNKASTNNVAPAPVAAAAAKAATKTAEKGAEKAAEKSKAPKAAAKPAKAKPSAKDIAKEEAAKSASKNGKAASGKASKKKTKK